MMIIRLLLATFLVVVLLGPHAGTLFLLAATAVWLLLWVVMPGKPEPVKDRRPGHGRGR
jgi:hypothetical protein